MKRCLHYLLLAALLVAVPLLCCVCAGYGDMLSDVMAFPPRCDDWVGLPERKWEARCPFSWCVFTGMSVVLVIVYRQEIAVNWYAPRNWKSPHGYKRMPKNLWPERTWWENVKSYF